jgi:hypothetical protein
MSLTLYYHPLASFCHKVLIALYEIGCGFDKRLIDLGNEADRAELQAIWPFRKFPARSPARTSAWRIARPHPRFFMPAPSSHCLLSSAIWRRIWNV